MTVELGISGISDATEIGAGGFGVVYRAVEADLGRTVAVKILTGNLDEGARHRFERERRAMGRLSGHPNIVTVYRGGYTEAGNAYLVMEFLDRGSLADRLANAGPLGWEEAVKFAIQLSGALETSHRAGVLHRDIKPGNILLSSLGNAKLCDFGIARLQGAPETKSSVVTASLAHAPPDIVNGSRPDARSDVYSLASTMFELVAATPPHVRPTDESMVPILARIARDPVPRLSESQLPAPVFEVVEHAMAKEPDDRPATAADFGQLLVAAQQRLGVAATPIPIEAVAPEADGDPGYIPFPDTGSGPLPAPSAQSPHTGEPGPTTGAGAASPPTVVTGADAAADVSGPTIVTGTGPTPADVTAISGQHDPAAWAPPTDPGRPETPATPAGPGQAEVSAATSAPLAAPGPSSSPAAGSPGGAGGGRPAWLLPVAALALVAGIVSGLIGIFALGGDDGDDGTGTVAGADDDSDDDSTDDDADDGADTDDEGYEAEDTSDDGDYATYESLSDDTGTITLDVPSAWADRRTGLGTDGTPQLSAGSLLEGGLFDNFSAPGVQLATAKISDVDAVDLDLVLDGYNESGCTSVDRTDVTIPYIGLAERFSDCEGTTTQLIHVVFLDRTNGLLAVMRVQMIDERDQNAADVMRRSLRLKDNVPE